MKLVWEGFKRVNTRSVQYNWRDVLAVLNKHSLKVTIETGVMIFHASKEVASREEGLALRKAVDQDLRLVHRNIVVRFEVQ